MATRKPTAKKTAPKKTAPKNKPPKIAGWKLVWHDEFEGDAIDPAKWDFDLGNGFYDYKNHAWVAGWGNEELQYYTHEPENVVVQDSCLHIRAVKAPLVVRVLKVPPVARAAKARATTSFSPPSWPSTRITANTSGTTRPPRAMPGTSPPPST